MNGLLRIFLVILLSQWSLAQSTLVVDANGGATFTTIQAAIGAALPGDTILVHPGTYDEAVTISRSLTVRSTMGPSVTHIAPSAAGTAVSIVGSATTSVLEGFSITGHGEVMSVDSHPGGVLVGFGATAEIRRCVVKNCVGSAPVGPSFVFPTVTGGAGGLHVDGSATATIADCVVLNNQGGAGVPGAGGPGGLLVEGTVGVTHSVFLGNIGGTATAALVALKGGGGAVELGPQGDLMLANAILRGNVGGAGNTGGGAEDEIEPPLVMLFATASVNHSDIDGPLNPFVTQGPGVIDADPLFVNPMADDFALLSGSPCIDTGDCGNTHPLSPDLSGNPRLRGFAPDMGAIEFQHDTTRQGTSEDILLTTVVNGNQADALTNTKTVGGGDNLVVHWESPCGSLVGAPYFLVGQFFTAGMPPLPFTPTIYLDTMGAAIIQGPAFMLPGGEDLIVSVPPGSFAPAVVRVQLLVITPLSQAPFGIASSDAQDLVLQ